MAKKRGARFEVNLEQSASGMVIGPATGRSEDIANTCLQLVSDWLGFADTDKYLSALPRKKASIFKRAEKARAK